MLIKAGLAASLQAGALCGKVPPGDDEAKRNLAKAAGCTAPARLKLEG